MYKLSSKMQSSTIASRCIRARKFIFHTHPHNIIMNISSAAPYIQHQLNNHFFSTKISTTHHSWQRSRTNPSLFNLNNAFLATPPPKRVCMFLFLVFGVLGFFFLFMHSACLIKCLCE